MTIRAPMANNKENVPPPTPRQGGLGGDQCTPPGGASSALGLRAWQLSTFASPQLRAISPNSKPGLTSQRDHSACGRPNTPLKVRKTRENLRDTKAYPDIPPPCLHITPGPQEDVSQAFAATDPPGYSSSVADKCKLQLLDEGSESTLPTYYMEDQCNTVPALSTPLAPVRMQRQPSVGRRMFSKVKAAVRPCESETSLMRRLSGRRKQSGETDRRAQSFEVSRDSIVSTPESDAVGAFTAQSSTTDCLLDPLLAPPEKPTTLSHDGSVTAEISIPCVQLSTTAASSAVDAASEQDVWIAIEAVVQENPASIPVWGLHRLPTRTVGDITSLRICFKPTPSCAFINMIGQKTVHDPKIGQTCCLFVKVRVFKTQTFEHAVAPDQDSLFTELESIVGTLETELLHIEARYRHSLLPMDNVVTLRKIVKIRRPKSESRWSMLGSRDISDDCNTVHFRLASYLADSYAPERALKLVDRYLGDAASGDEAVDIVRSTLQKDIQKRMSASCCDTGTPMADKPAVIVRDIDVGEHYSTAPCTPQASTAPLATTSTITNLATPLTVKPRSTSLSAMTSLFPNTDNATSISCNSDSHSINTTDDARKLWRHIRHNSLSAKQLADLTAEPIVHQLETDDEHLRELRRQALANKRSIGAETLKAWKWDGKMMAVAPWL